MSKRSHCVRCKNPERKVLWSIAGKGHCNHCFDERMEREMIDLDDVRRLSDNMDDFGGIRDNKRNRHPAGAAATA